MAEVQFVPDHVAINQIRFSWQGMIGRDLNRRLRTLEFRGRMSAGVDTGALRASINTSRTVIADGLEGKVGSPMRYAAPHHEGARPHVIRPRRGKYLRFMVGGRIVFATRVNHPGNRPTFFLSRHLREAVR